MKRIITTLVLAAACGMTPTAFALTSTDSANLLFLKQEEKVARDVYQALYAQWGHVTFRNISLSEQRHMDAVDGLIARYRLADTTPAQPGQFTIPELQALYDKLIAAGSQSLLDALAVGVLIEETDIADIEEMLNTTRESAIRRVLTNLQNGSYNHLDAFNNALAQLATSLETSTTSTGGTTVGSGQPAAPAPNNGQRQRGRR
jgi:hypothetical protein